MTKKKAVFLDRDGIINKERKDYVKNISELEIFPHVAKCIKELKDNGFLIIVVTNQSAINRGLMKSTDLEQIHNTIQQHLKTYDTAIDAFYYCPHRPDENCSCRKPNPGLLYKASKEFTIDIRSSWFIGNNDTDIMAGFQAGCRVLKIVDPLKFSQVISKILSDN